MGFINWCQDRWLMMLRTKPHYISAFGRKRSSLKGPPKIPSREGKCVNRLGAFISVVTMFYSLSHGVLLVLSEGVDSSSMTTYLVSLIVAGIVAISSGLCLIEYIRNQFQEVPSIYSCCYQYSSEVLAFFIGWTWILSQAAVISAVCKVLATHINEWTNGIPRKFLEKLFFDYAKDVSSLTFLLIFILFILTGFAETTAWYVLFMPAAFVMIATMYIIGCITTNSDSSVVSMLQFGDITGIDEVLSKSAISILFFSGPQCLLRIPLAHDQRNTTAIIGPLNGIILIIASVFIMAATFLDRLVIYSSPKEILSLVSNILCTISLCSIGIEAFYPLHYTIEDMSADGLLFRSLSKKWKPFCFPVSSAVVHLLTFIVVGLMSVFLPLLQVLYLIALFPLLVGGVVPLLVLHERYRNKSAWQYEPMFHTSAKSIIHNRSRKKSEEFQYSQTPGLDVMKDCEMSTTCIKENLTDSASSDTDVDSVVEQYKEQTRIANISKLDDSVNSNPTPEPTSSSAFRAKLYISLLMIISFIVSLLLNFGNITNNFPVVVIVLLSLLLSTVVQSLLICLPQNKKQDKSNKCCSKIPSMPWIPGIASILSCCLSVHTLIMTWKVCLVAYFVGTLLYLAYGMQSSTAANSFYNMRTTHITLRPLPSYGNNCISQIIPSQRKSVKSKKHKKLKTGNL